MINIQSISDIDDMASISKVLSSIELKTEEGTNLKKKKFTDLINNLESKGNSVIGTP